MMKYAMVFVAFLVLFLCSINAQDVPNAGFESWTSGSPTNWLSNNVPLTATPITKSTEPHSGDFAVKGSVVTISIVTLPPVLLSGTNGIGFAMGLRPGALHGFYKLTATGGDSFYVAIVLKKNTSPIGGGVFISGANTSSYQEFVANIYYYNQTDMPDTAIVSMALANSGGQTHVGSFFIVDDLSFGKATGVHENSSVVPSTYALSQNFPNPFNPVTTIEFSLPRSGRTTLTILNVLGEEVARLVDNEVQAGNHIVQWNASAVPSGMYFYQLRSGNFLQTMKLLLLK